MSKIGNLRSAVVLPLAAFVVVAVGGSSPALAKKKEKAFEIFYTFTNGADGANPYGGVIADKAGNLYGTTYYGGPAHSGSVFELTPAGKVTFSYDFPTGGGYGPLAGVTRDSKGNLYGTTSLGGANDRGTVFKLAPDGTKTTLHDFTAGNDGSAPYDALILDKKGNLYGTTAAGGPGGAAGCGVIFKMTPKGKETVLHSFTSNGDGCYPTAGLIADSAGNFYGTTYYGGNYGYGTVFKLTPDGTETVLYSFIGGSDGNEPYAGLIMDKAGNLYGTTTFGGTFHTGNVFKLAPDGTETTLYSFAGQGDGIYPSATLVMDKAGNLYGVAFEGGADDQGLVFEIAPDETETVLHTFTGGPDGTNPKAPLLISHGADGKNCLYGTTTSTYMGNAYGIVFKLKM